jgi:hypothetical protein
MLLILNFSRPNRPRFKVNALQSIIFSPESLGRGRCSIFGREKTRLALYPIACCVPGLSVPKKLAGSLVDILILILDDDVK